MKHKLVIVRERKPVLLPARGVHAVFNPARNLQSQQQVKLAVTVTQVHVQEQSLVIHLREHGRQALGVLARAVEYASRVKHKLVIVRERKLVLLPALGAPAV